MVAGKPILKRRHVVWVLAGALVFACIAVLWAHWECWASRPDPTRFSQAVAYPAPAHGGRPNHLVKEKSPYLLQHAYNPVDWYPWGEEAFARARREQKPIFLSIGYSTCHWCHVMERESFESEEIARVMNENFVSIKVDREERPDVDRYYMAFVVGTTGSGGWPMTVFLTPDLKPFFGGTYFPPHASGGMPGLYEMLGKVSALWKNRRVDLVTSADRVSMALRKALLPAGGQGRLNGEAFETAFHGDRQRYDSLHGGFGNAPKFPSPVRLDFLLHYFHRTHDQEALRMVTHTLKQMAAGGIHDQIGGGFHRYSTDREWLVPHFEKMLYDQAQLANVYLEAHQITGDTQLLQVARDILDYVLRDMHSPDGGFYSAEDADSPADAAHPDKQAEGAFYLWTYQELAQVLDTNTFAVFTSYYGVKPTGNIPRDQRGEMTGKNILHVATAVALLARQHKATPEALEKLLANARVRLLEARQNRPRPGRDDKVLTSWNGLMISALARGYQVTQDKHYLKAAMGGADFILRHLRDGESGEIRRRFRDGQGAIEGNLDDYAFFIAGLFDLYEASFRIEYLNAAIALQEKQDQLFLDAEGGYFDTTGRDASVTVRSKTAEDNVEPAGSSVAARNLIRLAAVTARTRWREEADNTVRFFSGDTLQNMPAMLVAADLLMSKPIEVVIAGSPQASDTRRLVYEASRRFLPHKVLLLADGADGQHVLGGYLPAVRSMSPSGGKATAFVCHDYVCELPTTDVTTFVRLLEGGEHLTSP